MAQCTDRIAARISFSRSLGESRSRLTLWLTLQSSAAQVLEPKPAKSKAAAKQKAGAKAMASAATKVAALVVVLRVFIESTLPNQCLLVERCSTYVGSGFPLVLNLQLHVVLRFSALYLDMW